MRKITKMDCPNANKQWNTQQMNKLRIIYITYDGLP